MAFEEGRATGEEVTVLAGWLILGAHVGSERTLRRRRARLLELGVPEPAPADLLAVELGAMVDAGEITAEEAVDRAGRFLLGLGGGALTAPPAG